MGAGAVQPLDAGAHACRQQERKRPVRELEKEVAGETDSRGKKKPRRRDERV